MGESKQYEIQKRVVIVVYKRVKAKKGSSVIDFDIFEKKMNNNLYKIQNRMSFGCYCSFPVLAVEIPNGIVQCKVRYIKRRDGKLRYYFIASVSKVSVEAF